MKYLVVLFAVALLVKGSMGGICPDGGMVADFDAENCPEPGTIFASEEGDVCCAPADAGCPEGMHETLEDFCDNSYAFGAQCCDWQDEEE